MFASFAQWCCTINLIILVSQLKKFYDAIRFIIIVCEKYIPLFFVKSSMILTFPGGFLPPSLVAPSLFNPSRPRQNGRHFADDIFKCIFLNENVWISIKISLKFVPKGPINNIPALVQIMAWRRPGDKPLSEPMMVRLPTHICVTRPQWVKGNI